MRLSRLAMAVLVGLPMLAHGANGTAQIGYGAKSKGMGGVGIALAQDSFASAMNPAGLTYLCSRADVAIHGRLANVRAETTSFAVNANGNRVSAVSDQWQWLPEVGAVWGPVCDQAFGLAFYTVGQSYQNYRGNVFILDINNPNKDPRFTYSAYAVTPSWAWQMNCVHSFGIALNVTFARANVENIQFNALTPVSIDPTRFSDRGANWQEGVSVRFGWVGQFFDCLRLGLTYQTKSYMGHFNKYKGFFPDRGSADLPSQFGFGVTYEPSCDVVLSAEVSKIFWRDGKWFRNLLTSLPVGNSNQFGANNGPGIDWNEQLIVKIGGAWAIWDCLTLRMGFNYGNSPSAAGNALGVLIPEAVTQHFTLGGTYVWNCWNELTINYVHGRSHTISGPLSPPDFDQVRSSTWRMWQRSFGVSYSRLF